MGFVVIFQVQCIAREAGTDAQDPYICRRPACWLDRSSKGFATTLNAGRRRRSKFPRLLGSISVSLIQRLRSEAIRSATRKSFLPQNFRPRV